MPAWHWNNLDWNTLKRESHKQLPWQIEEGDNPGKLQKADPGELGWVLGDGVCKRPSD